MNQHETHEEWVARRLREKQERIDGAAQLPAQLREDLYYNLQSALSAVESDGKFYADVLAVAASIAEFKLTEREEAQTA